MNTAPSPILIILIIPINTACAILIIILINRNLPRGAHADDSFNRPNNLVKLVYRNVE